MPNTPDVEVNVLHRRMAVGDEVMYRGLDGETYPAVILSNTGVLSKMGLSTLLVYSNTKDEQSFHKVLGIVLSSYSSTPQPGQWNYHEDMKQGKMSAVYPRFEEDI